jgi:Fe-S-cluster containining protein
MSMRCLHCGECCKETEMLLCNEDIVRLERKGYAREFFSVCDSQGFIFLRNVDGCCVFYDAEKRRCKVRGNRPSGCRVYPVIYDEAEGIVVDDICPAKCSVTEKQKAKRGKKVLQLLERIDAEAEERRIE